MQDILNLVQQTLDALLVTENSAVFSFWGRRAEVDADPQSQEYVIYTFSSDNAEVSADGDLMIRTATVALQYYVKYSVARTYAGRQTATERMDSIMEAMRSAGFGCSAGWSEIGDVDDVGFATFRSYYEIPHFMDGE